MLSATVQLKSKVLKLSEQCIDILASLEFHKPGQKHITSGYIKRVDVLT